VKLLCVVLTLGSELRIVQILFDLCIALLFKALRSHFGSLIEIVGLRAWMEHVSSSDYAAIFLVSLILRTSEVLSEIILTLTYHIVISILICSISHTHNIIIMLSRRSAISNASIVLSRSSRKLLIIFLCF
jgi:hypothetical protein